MSRTENNNRYKCLVLYVAFLVVLINQLANEPFVSASKDKGDDIILAKGKIILRGGKGKGNIILDPGHSSDGGHHEIPSMMPMMGHFNPFAFYPMQQHQPQVMIRPIYIEDHSHMQQQHHHMEEHHEPQHHEQHQYHQDEPQHYEPHHHEEEQHHEEHHEQPHYEHSGGGEEHQQQQHEGYEHPLMSLLSMHGSGPQPIYQPHQGQQQQQQQQQQLQQQQPQQQIVMQAYQRPDMYAQLSPEQQAAAYQQAQYIAAEQEATMRQQQLQQQQQQQQQELQQGQSSEVSSHSPADSVSGNSSSPSSGAKTPFKATSAVTALLEKSANNPLIKRIKPLFKRNKDQKDSSQKKS